MLIIKKKYIHCEWHEFLESPLRNSPGVTIILKFLNYEVQAQDQEYMIKLTIKIRVL